GIVPLDRAVDDVLDDGGAGLRQGQPHDRGPALGGERLELGGGGVAAAAAVDQRPAVGLAAGALLGQLGLGAVAAVGLALRDQVRGGGLVEVVALRLPVGAVV